MLQHVGQGDADHVPLYRHPDVVARGAVVVAAAHYHHAHARVGGLLDGQVHGAFSAHGPQRVVGVQHGRRGVLADDADVGGRVVTAGLHAVHVELQAYDAVRVEAHEIRLDQAVRNHLGVAGRHAEPRLDRRA